MYTVPESFARRMDRAFNGRLRVRWSLQKHEFHVEQKVRRGLFDSPITDTYHDDAVRLRDGYLYLLSIRPGDRMPCPRCGMELKVPVREIREVQCELCKVSRREYRVPAGFFPLDDHLIEYLQGLDPERDMSVAKRKAVDLANAKRMTQQQKTVLDRSLGHAADDFVQLTGIPMTGYTGRAHMWER